jgi:hypothetical protein
VRAQPTRLTLQRTCATPRACAWGRSPARAAPAYALALARREEQATCRMASAGESGPAAEPRSNQRPTSVPPLACSRQPPPAAGGCVGATWQLPLAAAGRPAARACIAPAARSAGESAAPGSQWTPPEVVVVGLPSHQAAANWLRCGGDARVVCGGANTSEGEGGRVRRCSAVAPFCFVNSLPLPKTSLHTECPPDAGLRGENTQEHKNCGPRRLDARRATTPVHAAP